MERLRPRPAGGPGPEGAAAVEASFECGTAVRFSIGCDERDVVSAAFVSSGCGYMIAAANVLSGLVGGKPLADLHGLGADDLAARVQDELGTFPADRSHCLTTAIGALRAAFAALRAARIEEFRGERALICTCFGIAEDDLETCIAARRLTTVGEVAAECRAGSGCGSCRMLVQEMLDSVV